MEICVSDDELIKMKVCGCLKEIHISAESTWKLGKFRSSI